MEKLFDTKPIPYDNIDDVVTEAYTRYGRNDLKEMSKKELQEELARVDKDIKSITEEINDASGCPSFSMKSQIETAENYREKILNQLSNIETVNESGIDKMISDLRKQLEKGIITEEVFERYKDKLESRRELYEEKVKRDIELQERKVKEENKKKKYSFKKFKERLSDYKKK